MNYSGIDLHSNNSVVSVIDETDRVVEEKRLPNDLARILAFLAPWRAELAGVVVESTYNWYWLVDGLQAAGFVVHLANTTAIKNMMGSSTAVTRPTRATWPICCAWASCLPAPFCR
jgi:transposase